MNKITRYTLLLSLSCLTSVPTRAEVVSSGDKLLEIISNNQTGSTVSIELGNNIILPQNVDVNGNAVVDGTEQKYKIDGNGGAGFVLGNGESLTIQNTVLTNFGGQTATGLIVDNAAGGDSRPLRCGAGFPPAAPRQRAQAARRAWPRPRPAKVRFHAQGGYRRCPSLRRSSSWSRPCGFRPR